MQRYASSWSGDNYTSWKTLKANISTILNMGLSGVANYGADIGGFWGPAPTA
jgi:alpha-glucosidase